ncbi:MAG: C-GCAxxG-C-C family protein [Marinilabiliales bacterium]|nr:C-GCAxxG-C-C family protein [Marinilabiliales bacterium]
MGGTEEESIMVAGFAGGIGLSGNTCGALTAAIWYKMLEWGKNNPTEKPSLSQ